MRSNFIKISVIVLLEEAEEGFHRFIKTLHDTLLKKGKSFEIIIVANGKAGFLRIELNKLQMETGIVKGFAFNKKTTQAVCLKAGFKEAAGDIIMVCGSYQQITDASLLTLLDSLDDNTDIISPCRQNRVDPAFNQIQSKVFNWLTHVATGTSLSDLSCTVKIFRREVLESVELYGNMYRFLPILAERRGFKNKEVYCDHLQERGKTGIYGVYEYLRRMVDILTIYFNTRFAWKPLRFFSAVGAVLIIIGLVIVTYVFFQKSLLRYTAR